MLNSFGSEYIEDKNYTGYNYYTVYEYDGDRVFSTSYVPDCTITWADGVTTYNYSGNVHPEYFQYIDHEYDEYGNLLKESVYSRYSEDEEWQIEGVTTYEYAAF